MVVSCIGRGRGHGRGRGAKGRIMEAAKTRHAPRRIISLLKRNSYAATQQEAPETATKFENEKRRLQDAMCAQLNSARLHSFVSSEAGSTDGASLRTEEIEDSGEDVLARRSSAFAKTPGCGAEGGSARLEDSFLPLDPEQISEWTPRWAAGSSSAPQSHPEGTLTMNTTTQGFLPPPPFDAPPTAAALVTAVPIHPSQFAADGKFLHASSLAIAFAWPVESVLPVGQVPQNTMPERNAQIIKHKRVSPVIKRDKPAPNARIYKKKSKARDHPYSMVTRSNRIGAHCDHSIDTVYFALDAAGRISDLQMATAQSLSLPDKALTLALSHDDISSPGRPLATRLQIMEQLGGRAKEKMCGCNDDCTCQDPKIQSADLMEGHAPRGFGRPDNDHSSSLHLSRQISSHEFMNTYDQDLEKRVRNAHLQLELGNWDLNAVLALQTETAEPECDEPSWACFLGEANSNLRCDDAASDTQMAVSARDDADDAAASVFDEVSLCSEVHLFADGVLFGAESRSSKKASCCSPRAGSDSSVASGHFVSAPGEDIVDAHGPITSLQGAKDVARTADHTCSGFENCVRSATAQPRTLKHTATSNWCAAGKPDTIAAPHEPDGALCENTRDATYCVLGAKPQASTRTKPSNNLKRASLNRVAPGTQTNAHEAAMASDGGTADVPDTVASFHDPDDAAPKDTQNAICAVDIKPQESARAIPRKKLKKVRTAGRNRNWTGIANHQSGRAVKASIAQVKPVHSSICRLVTTSVPSPFTRFQHPVDSEFRSGSGSYVIRLHMPAFGSPTPPAEHTPPVVCDALAKGTSNTQPMDSRKSSSVKFKRIRIVERVAKTGPSIGRVLRTANEPLRMKSTAGTACPIPSSDSAPAASAVSSSDARVVETRTRGITTSTTAISVSESAREGMANHVLRACDSACDSRVNIPMPHGMSPLAPKSSSAPPEDSVHHKSKSIQKRNHPRKHHGHHGSYSLAVNVDTKANDSFHDVHGENFLSEDNLALFPQETFDPDFCSDILSIWGMDGCLADDELELSASMQPKHICGEDVEVMDHGWTTHESSDEGQRVTVSIGNRCVVAVTDIALDGLAPTDETVPISPSGKNESSRVSLEEQPQLVPCIGDELLERVGSSPSLGLGTTSCGSNVDCNERTPDARVVASQRLSVSESTSMGHAHFQRCGTPRGPNNDDGGVTYCPTYAREHGSQRGSKLRAASEPPFSLEGCEALVTHGEIVDSIIIVGSTPKPCKEAAKEATSVPSCQVSKSGVFGKKRVGLRQGPSPNVKNNKFEGKEGLT
eukprot:scaffold79886_cov33-Tisochrysis_lutea.AAC.1